jgi:hypothetical protein
MIRWTAIVVLLLCAGPARAWHEVVALEHAATGRFLSVKGDGTAAFDATSIGPKETFTLLDLDFGPISDKNPAALRTLEGQFVSVPQSGSPRADAPSPGASERFVLHASGCSGPSPVRPGLCDGATVFFEQPGQICLASDPADSSGALTTHDCYGDLPLSRFKITFLGRQPDLLSLSAPFSLPQGIVPTVVFGVDHKHIDGSTPSNKLDCTNASGRDFHCYGGHEGTDFMLATWFVGMNFGSIDVVTAAPGFVVKVDDSQPDRCYWDPSVDGEIYCPGAKDNKVIWNVVIVVQDDGVIVEYGHLKRGSVVVHEGDRVECGTVLGKIGSSGRSSAPHLHFDMAQLALPQPTSCASGSTPPALPAFPESGTEFKRFAALDGPGCTVSARLDPYDSSIAPPRQMLWFSSGNSLIPKNMCATAEGKGPVLPGGPGTPCSGESQCRPWLVCNSDGTCQPKRDTGQPCGATRDCAFGTSCDNGLCTRHGLFPGQRCDATRVCGPGLECVHDVCGVVVTLPPGEDGCPSGQRLRCPLDRGCFNNRDGDCRRQTFEGEKVCDRECRP